MLIGKFFSFQLWGSEGADHPGRQSGGVAKRVITAKIEVIRGIGGHLTFGGGRKKFPEISPSYFQIFIVPCVASESGEILIFPEN